MGFGGRAGGNDSTRFDIMLVSYDRRYPVYYTARCLGRLFGWGPADAINALKHLPTTLATGLTRSNAATVKEALEKVGGTINVVHHR